MATVAVGQEAPDFTLRDDTLKEVTLSALRGQTVVLEFFPLAFSPMCTAEMCEVRNDYSAFQEKGAAVYGISRDSVWTLKAFKEKEGLTHSLLADMKGDVAKAYGCWNEAIGFAERLTVIIGPDGKITYVQHNGAGEKRDQKDAIAALG